jgi:hypothetical protein
MIFQNLPVIAGKFSPFTENLLLPVNEILYRIRNYRKGMVCQFKNGMVCPPATSEAGPKQPRSISNPNFV